MRVLNKTTRGIRPIRILSQQQYTNTHIFHSVRSTHHSPVFTQMRHQSTTQEVSKNEESEQPKKDEYKPFIAPSVEASLDKLALNLEQTKEALDKLSAKIAEKNDKILQIGKQSNEQSSLYAKYAAYLELMVELRSEVIEQYPSFNSPDATKELKDVRFRRCIGKWSLKDEQLLEKSMQFHRQAAKTFFNIDLPEQFVFPDRIASGIYFNATSAARRRVFEDQMEDALKHIENQVDFMKKVFAPVLFEEEMKLLSQQEQLLAVAKKQKILKDKYMGMLKEDITSVTDKEWNERYDLKFEDLTEEDEKFVLATPEGWLAYKFQLSESLMRLG